MSQEQGKQPADFEGASGQASLAWLGLRFQEMGIWKMLTNQIEIQQRIHVHTPMEKLMDEFINILSGGCGTVEINTRIRPDRVVQLGFGRWVCAEQSTVNRTLDACDDNTVKQTRQALGQITQQHGYSLKHDYAKRLQIVDIDLTGIPCGKQGELAETGYFPGAQHNRHGRQLGRVTTSLYDEIISQRLYAGRQRLDQCLSELLADTEQVLGLSDNDSDHQSKRKNTVIRIDAGGGTDEHINYCLNRNYLLMTKVFNWKRVKKLADTVHTWTADPVLPHRQLSWVGLPHPYLGVTRQLAVRHLKKNGEWAYSVLVFNLSDDQLVALLNIDAPAPSAILQSMLNALHFYDQRGGGIETQNKVDKQGLAIGHRNKHSFMAQDMLILLAQLAHNFIIWIRNQLSQVNPRFSQFSMTRMTRDVFHIPGTLSLSLDAFDPDNSVRSLSPSLLLNPRHPYAADFLAAFGCRYE